MDNSLDIFNDVQQGADGLSEVGVHAGFPNPAAERDHQKPTLSLDDLLVPRPNSTYFFAIEGHSYSDQGITDGDIAVIDRALRARPQDLVLAWNDGFTICRQRQVTPDMTMWGVITAIVHRYRGKR